MEGSRLEGVGLLVVVGTLLDFGVLEEDGTL